MSNTYMKIVAILSAVVIAGSGLIPLVVNLKLGTDPVGTNPTEATEYEEIDVYPSEWFVTDDDVVPTVPAEYTPELAEPVTEPSTGPNPSDPDTWALKLSDEDMYLLATAIYLEGGAESYQCQLEIGSVIVNRMTNTGSSLHDVLYAKDQFSVAPLLSRTTPTDMQIAVAMDLVINGSALPACVTFFRADRYHDKYTVDTSIVKDYHFVDRTYFSHDIRICGNCH